MYEVWLLLTLILLLIIAAIEIWNPALINEGFANLVSVGDSAFWSRWMPRRGDIGLDAHSEQSGYHRDIRYFAGYTDVQRLGQDHDFCRMVQEDGSEDDKFFACALGGTEGLSTIKFRTPSTKDGLELSRDDYMNTLTTGYKGYCRILKTDADTFEPKCNPANDTGFKPDLVTDPSPPPAIQQMLQFYEGIMFWLRLKDDMQDYAKNLTVSVAGSMEINEDPHQAQTEGLEFNGVDQFLRIGDSANLSFGNVVQLKYLRAVSFWVYFEEFTNNAKIYDFGNGAGHDNVVLGILGRGNSGASTTTNVVGGPKGYKNEEPFSREESLKTIPAYPSGQQCTLEQSPQTAMLQSSSNVNQYDCPSPEIFGKIVDPLIPKAAEQHDAKTADLIYEIFENKMRKLHIQVKDAVPLRKWTHIVITTTNNDAFKPGLIIYKDGKAVHREESAWLPQTNDTTKNYLGKSNWANATSQMDNKDELFKGKLFDFRGYKTAMSEAKVEKTVAWGKTQLDLAH